MIIGGHLGDIKLGKSVLEYINQQNKVFSISVCTQEFILKMVF